MAIKILIDSASDINRAEAKELGIEMISIIVNFGQDEYLDGETLLPEQFYEKLATGVQPQTSQINPFRFKEKLKEMTANGDEVLVFTLSSKLSGTYRSALQAAEEFSGVFVIDTLTVAMGERLLCLYAMELIERGLSASEIFKILQSERHNVNITAIVDTLEYLKNGGRISASAAVVGSMLSIKPIVGIADGKVQLIAKPVGSKRANNQLKALAEEKTPDLTKPHGVLWSGVDKSVLNKWFDDCPQVWAADTRAMMCRPIGTTIGTHVGPGAVGIAFFEK